MPVRSAVLLLGLVLLAEVFVGSAQAQNPQSRTLALHEGASPRNVVFILTDDHRYDALGYLGHPFAETPNLDALAQGGAHFSNAFVTTSLCSPSRASILTGQYMHNHGVIDNGPPTRADNIFFPEYLQHAGYRTAFIGKWHMGGGSDEQRPGFDRWVSFRGQGRYYPPGGGDWTLNVDGERVPQQGYITDELTDYAVEWLDTLDPDESFFLYLSHKGIHDNFSPAERHLGRYDDQPFPAPPTMAVRPFNQAGKPRWTRDQRNSWHGVDFPYHNQRHPDVEVLYRRYAEALLSIDESVGRVVEWLEDKGQLENTLIVYMGDNGFAWGEHGLIDKRTAYEASMRVPMIAYAPGLLPPGSIVDGMVANIDIAPTVLEAAGLMAPDHMDGRSFLPLASGTLEAGAWRQELLYEYFWEIAFPQTPTMFALRTPQYKFIEYYGIWDADELYDLQNDPIERNNLFYAEAHQETVRAMRERLHAVMQETGVTAIPLRPKWGGGLNLRLRDGAQPASFPPEMIREKDPDH